MWNPGIRVLAVLRNQAVNEGQIGGAREMMLREGGSDRAGEVNGSVGESSCPGSAAMVACIVLGKCNGVRHAEPRAGRVSISEWAGVHSTALRMYVC